MVSLVTEAHRSCFTPAVCGSRGSPLFLLAFYPLVGRIGSGYLGIAFCVLTVSCSVKKNDMHHCIGVLQRKRTSGFYACINSCVSSLVN